MKKRVVSGFIFTFLIVVIMLLNIPRIDTICITVLSILGIFEYNKAFKKAGYKPVSVIQYISCLVILTMGCEFIAIDRLLLIKILAPTLLIIIFIVTILKNLKITIIDVAITVLGIIYIPVLFSFMKSILLMENGRIYILYVFLGAFASDTFAYLIGCKFGKRKLCKDISPKKTVEGAIGGIIGVLVSYIILTYVANTFFAMHINMIYMAIVGIIAAVAGQFGDLAASSIKRYCDVKDFSNIIPGHGGILDRFDSILFVAPVVYMFLQIYQLF